MMKKLNTKTFLERFMEKYPNKLGLDMSHVNYIDMKTPVKVRCITHNEVFMNNPQSLLYSGSIGCKKCKSDKISNKKRKVTPDEFMRRSQLIHNNRYDYSLIEFKGTKDKVKIICPDHGIFEQNVQSHYNGYGCPQCGYKTLRKSNDDFIAEATAIHKNRYDYTAVNYINNYSDVVVKCKTHGAFYISPKSHIIYQRGCPDCFSGNRSWKEISWLDSMNVDFENRQKVIYIDGQRFLVDALVGDVVYEFWGDFWHGNPEIFDLNDRNGKNGKLFKELYEMTQQKRIKIKNAGFQLIEIWENEWDNICAS